MGAGVLGRPGEGRAGGRGVGEGGREAAGPDGVRHQRRGFPPPPPPYPFHHLPPSSHTRKLLVNKNQELKRPAGLDRARCQWQGHPPTSTIPLHHLPPPYLPGGKELNVRSGAKELGPPGASCSTIGRWIMGRRPSGTYATATSHPANNQHHLLPQGTFHRTTGTTCPPSPPPFLPSSPAPSPGPPSMQLSHI